MHLQGRGRNEIARILNGQKMRISEATITHLIQNCKRQQSNSEPSSQLNSVQVNIESDVLINQDVTSQDETIEKEESELAFKQSRPLLPDPENPPIDWDETWQRRFWTRIMQEKKQRERDILLMEQQRQQIAQIRQSIDQQKYDLEAREAKLQSIQPLIPSVKECSLQE